MKHQMSFDEYLIIHFPKYWDISKKRVAFNQLPMPMRMGMYLDYFEQQEILTGLKEKIKQEIDKL